MSSLQRWPLIGPKIYMMMIILLWSNSIYCCSLCISPKNQYHLSIYDWCATPIQTYTGDSIPVAPRSSSGTQQAEISKPPLQVVYVDDHIVVVNKPSGIRCVPGPRRQPSILDTVYDIFGYAKTTRKETTFKKTTEMDQMVVHRLDCDTSGLVIFARTEASLRYLQNDFRARKVRKTYVALVCGHLGFPGGGGGEIDLPLVRDPLHPAFMRVATPKSQSDWLLVSQSTIATYPTKFTSPKESLTYYDILSHEQLLKRNMTTSISTASVPVTRVSLIPVTGRTHQLRVHCAALGHPIVGDPIYGYNGEGSCNGGFDHAEMDCIHHGKRASLLVQQHLWEYHQQLLLSQKPPLYLHATELRIRHPFTNAPIIFRVPPPF